MSCTYRHNISRGGNHDPIYLFFAEEVVGLLDCEPCVEGDGIHISVSSAKEQYFLCVEC